MILSLSKSNIKVSVEVNDEFNSEEVLRIIEETISSISNIENNSNLKIMESENDLEDKNENSRDDYDDSDSIDEFDDSESYTTENSELLESDDNESTNSYSINSDNESLNSDNESVRIDKNEGKEKQDIDILTRKLKMCIKSKNEKHLLKIILKNYDNLAKNLIEIYTLTKEDRLWCTETFEVWCNEGSVNIESCCKVENKKRVFRFKIKK